MPDALELALQNAAYNAPKGEELHLENLDSIAGAGDTLVSPQEDRLTDWQIEQLKQDLQSSRASNFASQYEMVLPKSRPYPEQEDLYAKAILSEFPIIKLRLDALADMITEMHLTIQNAKQSMPDKNLNHRSLEEWPDTTLLNELVNRENDLMPFYYELLKRIGSPELQSLVMSSMQGKNASMVTLAQLCSALAPAPVQAQPQVVPQTQIDANAELAKLAAMNAHDRQMLVDKINQSPFKPYTAIPPTQY